MIVRENTSFSHLVRMTKNALRFVDAAGFVELNLYRTVDMSFKRFYKYLIAFIKVLLKYLLISYFLRVEILNCLVVL